MYTILQSPDATLDLDFPLSPSPPSRIRELRGKMKSNSLSLPHRKYSPRTVFSPMLMKQPRGNLFGGKRARTTNGRTANIEAMCSSARSPLVLKRFPSKFEQLSFIFRRPPSLLPSLHASCSVFEGSERWQCACRGSIPSHGIAKGNRHIPTTVDACVPGRLRESSAVYAGRVEGIERRSRFA